MNLGLTIGLMMFAGTQALAGATGAAPSLVGKEPEPRSVVIADMVGGPRFRADLQVTPPSGSSAAEQGVFGMFNLIYEADFHIRRVLSGPTIGPQIKILFIGNHLDAWRNVRMFMAVGHNSLGQPWGDRNWIKVADQVCLDSPTIQSLNVEAAFSQSTIGGDGLRCVPS
jgi:hypothetical protein